jgi:hypothetical protein
LRNPNRVTSLKEQCTKKLGFKNIFNEEYELYHPKKTCEYIFSKSFWFITWIGTKDSWFERYNTDKPETER